MAGFSLSEVQFLGLFTPPNWSKSLKSNNSRRENVTKKTAKFEAAFRQTGADHTLVVHNQIKTEIRPEYLRGSLDEKAAAEIAKDLGHETTKVIDEVLKERLESHDLDRKVFEE
jgi:hypothetical protein